MDSLQGFKKIVMVFTIFLFVSLYVAVAGAYDVRVENPTGKKCTVRLHISEWPQKGVTQDATIEAGGHYTFCTDAMYICSAYLQGRIEASPGVWKRVSITYFIGDKTSSSSSDCDYVGGVAHMTVCRKRGEENSEIQDLDYEFCRQ